MFHDDTLGFYKVNSYCNTAIKVTGKEGVCTQCPFGDCLHELKPSEKQLIMQTQSISLVYKCKDRGIDPQGLFPGIPETRIMAWLRRRNTIEPKIQQYGIKAYAPS